MPGLKPSLRAKALRYLSIREHSRLELARKLARHAQEGDDIDALLDSLEAAKLLSQERFSEALVHRRAARFGNSRILSELKSHGIDTGDMAQIRAGLERDELARARAVWQRKFGSAPEDATTRAKQMRFLQQRGFSLRTIQALMRNDGAREDETDEQS